MIQGSLRLTSSVTHPHIRPFYVQCRNGYPQFRFVVIACRSESVLASTVNDGLAQLFGQPPAQPLPSGGAAPATPTRPRGQRRIS